MYMINRVNNAGSETTDFVCLDRDTAFREAKKLAEAEKRNEFSAVRVHIEIEFDRVCLYEDNDNSEIRTPIVWWNIVKTVIKGKRLADDLRRVLDASNNSNFSFESLPWNTRAALTELCNVLDARFAKEGC